MGYTGVATFHGLPGVPRESIQDLFLCIECGYSANADQNASEIIALRALHQIQKGGRYQKFPVFQQWLIGMRQVGKAAVV